MKPYIIIAILLIITHFLAYHLGELNKKVKIVKDTDTLITYTTITDTIIEPEFYEIVKKDTIRDTVNNVIFIKDQSNYVAEVDTTYEDDLAKLNVKYISDIPLSKKSYFNIALDVKKEVVFVPAYKEYEPDKWGLGFGALCSFKDSVRVNLFGNVSYKILNYRHFEFPITFEIQLDNDFKMIEQTIKAEGKFKF